MKTKRMDDGIDVKNIVCVDNRSYSGESIRSLAENIKSIGLLQPIRLRPDSDGTYSVVFGRRRFRALLELKRERLVPGEYVISDADDDGKAAFCENFMREDLTLLEEIEQLEQLQKTAGPEEIAAMLGKSRRWIALRLNLARLSEEWKKRIANSDSFSRGDITKLELISRFPEDVQNSFFDDLKESSVDDVKSYLNQRETRLDSAIFDRTDCRSCQKRNVCNLLLFDSSEETCLDCSCFERKTHETVLEEIKSIKGKNLKIYLVAGSGTYYYYGDHLKDYWKDIIPQWQYTVSDGPKNAYVVSGEGIGTYISIDYKARSAHSEKTEKKTKTLADRLNELNGKRVKHVAEKLIVWLESDSALPEMQKRFDTATLYNKFVVLATAYGTYGSYRSGTYGYFKEAISSEREYINPQNFIQHLWLSIRRHLVEIIKHFVLEQTLMEVVEGEPKEICQYLGVDYSTLKREATEKIKPSKTILEMQKNGEK